MGATVLLLLGIRTCSYKNRRHPEKFEPKDILVLIHLITRLNPVFLRSFSVMNSQLKVISVLTGLQ